MTIYNNYYSTKLRTNCFFKKIILITLLINQFLLSEDKQFVIVIPSYKNERWYKKNLDSVFEQTYKKFRVIYVADDLSTGQLVQNYIKEKRLKNKIILKQNNERKLALNNFYYAIHSCQDDEIIVCLDGDDWLENKFVLEYLNNVYQDSNIWLTYGQFIEYPNNKIGGAKELPFDVIKNKKIREYEWVTAHLRSFYAGLFKKIIKEDLLYENKFFPMAGDVAMMLPMIEMAYDKIKFTNKILYVYNTSNPISDNKVDKELQAKLYVLIRSKQSYEKIDSFITQSKNEKIDLIIFNNEIETLKLILSNLYDSNNIYKITIFYRHSSNQLDILKNKYPKIDFIDHKKINHTEFINFIRQIFLNNNNYLFIINDNLELIQQINIDKILRSIEMTNAYGMYFFSSNSLLTEKVKKDHVEVVDDIFSTEFNEYNLSPYINGFLFRKSEINTSNNKNNILNFEIEWRYIGWMKKCLAQVIGK